MYVGNMPRVWQFDKCEYDQEKKTFNNEKGINYIRISVLYSNDGVIRDRCH